jgi:benzylsuccinate CoA-transferase BbsF subunit
MPPHINGTPGPESSALYETCNAGKLGMCLDLRTDAGRDVVRDLAAWADVVVESFSPGTMTRWGLDQATLRADNPRLIVLSTSLCGQTGPWSSLAGFGNVGAALAGFQHLVGWPDRLPLGPYGPYTDYVGPRFALVALLAALDWRRTSGEGCFIDVAQIEAGLQFLAPYVAHWFADGTVAERMGNADSQLAPHGVYPCRDDRWVAIVARDDGEWARLASVMDLDLQGRWTTTGERLEAGEELDRVLSAWTVDRSADELEAKLQAQGVAAHVVASSADFCSDPQLIHRRHLVPVDHPRHGQVGVEGPRYLLSATPGAVRSHAPLFNEHTELVLRDILGYDDDRITILRAADILV